MSPGKCSMVMRHWCSSCHRQQNGKQTVVGTQPVPESSTPNRKPHIKSGVTECLAGRDPGGNGWVIPEAVTGGGERLICIAVSVARCISRRQVYLFSTEALLHSTPLAASESHPSHTWIRNEIISLPPQALITQPRWLDGPGHTGRARKQIEKRKGWRWWSGRVEVLSFGKTTQKYAVTEHQKEDKKINSKVTQFSLFCLLSVNNDTTTVFNLNPEILVSSIHLEINFAFTLKDRYNMSSSTAGW